jgi:hypothetical protein
MKEHGPSYTNSEGTPNQERIYRSDFYDDMGSILGGPLVVGNEVYFGSADGNVYALM